MRKISTLSTRRLGNLDTVGVLVERTHCECGTNGGVPIVGSDSKVVRNVVYRDMAV